MKSIHFCVLALLIFLIPTIYVNADPVSKGVHELNVNQELLFIENIGQITDQHYNTRNDIDYKVGNGGVQLFIGSGHMHYQWLSKLQQDSKNQTNKILSYRLDVELIGSNRNILPEVLEQSNYFEQYYLAHTTSENKANSSKKIIYRSIYPHIDWVLYTNSGKVKYDFIIHPGANTNDIQVRYNGATDISLNKGDLHVTTPAGEVIEPAPYTYNSVSKKEIRSEYVLEGNILTFNLDRHAEQDIIIDPTIEWATYYGGSAIDNGYAITNDTSQNLYMVGSSQSANNIATTGNSFKDTLDGTQDGFVVKITEAGFRVWATYYGGKGQERLYSATVNSQQELIVSGITDTSSNLATPSVIPAVHQTNHGGGSSDCILMKMSTTNGSRIWCTYFGGASSESYSDDYQTHACIDDNDNIYLVGTTQSDTGIAANTSPITTRSGKHDAFIAKFDTNGDRIWGRYFGGSEDDIFKKSIIDGTTYIYVVGEFSSGGVASSSNVHQSTKKGGKEALLTRINAATGSISWATYYGGTSDEDPRGIGLDQLHNIYISGSTQSSADIATNGVQIHQTSLKGSSDAFLAKFDSTGAISWGTYYGGTSANGGSGTDHGYNLWIDEADNIHMTGSTSSNDFIVTNDAYQSTRGGGLNGSDFDAFIVTFDQQGSRTWGSYYGGPGSDYGQDILLQNTSHVYVVGKTESSTGVAYNTNIQYSNGGLNDAFMAKFTPDTSVFIFQPFTDIVHCIGDTFSVPYGVTSSFGSGNSFNVELSDASGSFNNPVIIGSTNSSVAGSILCTLPTNMTGNGFRIRILGSTPIDTSFDNGSDISIKPKPIQPVASSNSPVCSNDTLKLYSTNSSAGATYLWEGPYNYIASGQNVTQINPIATSADKYYVTVDLNGCIRSDTVTVTVLQAPQQPTIATNAPLCENDSLTLFGVNITPGSTVTWTGPNGFSSNQNNPPTKYNVSLADSGYYYLTTELNNCSSSDSALISVSTRPDPVFASSNSPVCSGDDIILTATTGTPVPVNYNWTGPANYSSSGASTVRQNSQLNHSGDYIITIDISGCKRADTINVNVLQSPDKPIANSNSPLCSGDTLKLTGGDITTGSSVTWTGPGGFSTSTQNVTRPNVSVNEGGFYILTSLLNGCSRSDTAVVDITQTVIANLNLQVTPGTTVCPTADMQFDVSHTQTGSSIIYNWSGPGGWTGNNSTVTRNNVDYADSGYYKINVQIDQCTFGADSVYLNVVDTISAPTLTTNSPVCFGDSVIVTNNHPYITQFTVTYPDNSSYTFGKTRIVRNIDNSFNGRYISMVSAGGCVAYDTAYVTVNPKPSIPVVSSNSPVCETTPLQLSSNSATSGVTYEWIGPGSYSSTDQNPVISNVALNAQGLYEVRAILNGCPSTYATTSVVVNPSPKPEIQTNSPICEGDILNMNVTENADNSYNWRKDNGSFTSNQATVTITAVTLTDAGIYTVTETNDNTGCEGKASATIEVTPIPTMPDIITNSPVCDGATLTLTTSDSSNDVAYTWIGPNGFISPLKNTTLTPVSINNAGTYTLQVNRGNCVVTDSVSVDIKPTPPKPELASNSPLKVGEILNLEITNPISGASYQWLGPNNYGSRVQNPVINNVRLENAGAYVATMTVNGCRASEKILVVIEDESLNPEELLLFPNPNKGRFTIKAKVRYDQLMAFEIVNAVGMIVFDDKADAVDLEMETEVNIQDYLPSGVYFLRITMSGQVREVPFTISR